MIRTATHCLCLSTIAAAQRYVPAVRDQLGHQHIVISPPNLRGTHFYLQRNESGEAFWSRFDDNYSSIEFRMGQLARAGVNYLRTWSSYRSYLAGRLIGYRVPGGSLATTEFGHWDRVKSFCDMANDFDMGVALVLFSTFGAASFASGTGDAYVVQSGTAPAPLAYLHPTVAHHAQLDLPHDVLADPVYTVGNKWERARIWIGHPDFLEGAGYVRDYDVLFRHKATDDWLQGDPGTPPYYSNLRDFCRGYLAAAKYAGVTNSPGLAEFQICNEPDAIHAVSTVSQTPPRFAPQYGVQWGDVCLTIFNLVGNNNPHSVPRHLATKGVGSLALYPSYDWDALGWGFSSASCPVKDLDRWNTHTTVDPYIRLEPPSGVSPGGDVYRQFGYAFDPSIGPGTSFLEHLRGHPAVPPNFKTNGPTPLARKPVAAEETCCRAGVLQRMTDYARHTVQSETLDQDRRLGNVVWALQSSDSPKSEFGVFMLPCGFSLSPHEDEAFNDNWGSPPGSAKSGASRGNGAGPGPL